MSTAAPRLESSIRQHLQPLLKADGFTGSGRNFRKLGGGFIQALNVQGSRYGGQFAINLGLHPVGLPMVFGETPELKNFKEVNCEFRRRLNETGSDQWWSHDNTEASMDAAVQAAAEVYQRIGRPHLALLSGADSPFHSLTPEGIPGFFKSHPNYITTNFRLALALARSRKLQGRASEAKAFADYALANMGAAKGFHAELEALSRLE
ncbi:DUF4304 domain-containing protein [Haloferula sp. BvORR071]|uniref:DUF4304 domain-containing protein n=1 Tax=Haloferula sp. BvORR071 TaxID=1396141 RepID=UPI00054F4567|nr:DUF4304 domain-containing protein [Haloferula sp. BvORR071]